MKWRTPLIAGVVGIAAFALVLVFAISPKGEAAKKVTSPLLGKVAPALQGTTIRGEPFDLDHFRGEWVLVNFFASWCPPCVAEHPELKKLSKDDGGPLQIVSVVSQDSNEEARKFFDDNGGNWPVVGGETAPIGIDYGLKKLPESFLVDPTGAVVTKFEGEITYNRVVDQIQRMSGASDSADSKGDGS